MKVRLLLLGLLAGFATHGHAAALRQAELTRVVNDVKILPPQQKAVVAKIGDTVRGPSAVSTGAQSRAELRFQDNTITRLGSNSIFTLDEASRTVDLEKGTILLQVPKKIGGLPTKIRTAAVTAAVTGTTVMVEYLPGGFVKVIVLEGEVDVFLTNDPSTFRTIRPGDMIIMQADAADIPEPVQVDLKRLKETSKLTSDKNFQALGNERHLDRAEFKQANLKAKGELHDTRFVIHGTGTDVTIEGKFGIRDLPVGGGAGPGLGGPGPDGPGAGPGGPGGQIGSGVSGSSDRAGLIGGPAVIDDDSSFDAGPPPTVSAWFGGNYGTGRGGTYRPDRDGGVGSYFGRRTNRIPGTTSFDQAMRSAGNWTEFRFQSLDIIGRTYGLGEARIPNSAVLKNLLLASATNITLSDTNPFNMNTSTGEWDLTTEELESLALVARNTITWNHTFTLYGSDQRVLLYTQGDEPAPTGPEPLGTPGSTTAGNGDIAFDAGYGAQLIALSGGSLEVMAGRDLLMSGTGVNPYEGTIEAGSVRLAAKRDVNLSTSTVAAKTSLQVQAGRTVRIGSSTTLKRLSYMDPVQVDILAEKGNIEIEGGTPGGTVIEGQSISLTSGAGSISINNATLSADHLRAVTYSPTGALLIGNSTLTGTMGIKLYAQGSNGRVQFVGPTTLNGPAIIAGKTVQVNSGVNVTVSNPGQLQIYADINHYNHSSHGNFTDGTNLIIFTPGGNQKPFATRPAY